ncbi:unnamed protein product [Callosobruchus maculatus]|uniref:Uncharacterized protein n=1 Tax=Callosobruchus maculatus TaxID=64391 RepID=A0A653BNM9_CALMS|nr:unnamed protein product [Callosobruchus maculatus]
MSYGIEWPEMLEDTMSSTTQELISQATPTSNLPPLQSSTVTESIMSTIQNTTEGITQVTTQPVIKITEILTSTKGAMTTITPKQNEEIPETNATIQSTLQNTTHNFITTTEVSTNVSEASTSDISQEVSSTSESILGQINNFLSQKSNTTDGDSENDFEIHNDMTIYIIVAALLLVTFLLIVGLSLLYKKHKRCRKVHESYNVRVSELNEYSPSTIKSDPESCKI